MASCPQCLTSFDDSVTHCPHDAQALVLDSSLLHADPELPAGGRVGEYVIEAKIGDGGFGTVYRAQHPVIGKAVAIKVLSQRYSSNPQMVGRFISEARAVNKIRHHNIVDIFAFGALPDGRRYFVMELLEGQPLDDLISRSGGLPPEMSLSLLAGVARALDAAHAAGVVHRDLKPENIFVVQNDGGMPIAKLLDFGIAKLQNDGAASKTQTGTPLGTPRYMSPEQCRARAIDHRSDIYSFGIVLFEVLTGRPPFDSDDIVDLLLQQTRTAAPTPSEVNPALPKAVDAPLLQMLEKDPAQRPPSVGIAFDAVARACGVQRATTPDFSKWGDLHSATFELSPRSTTHTPVAHSQTAPTGELASPFASTSQKERANHRRNRWAVASFSVIAVLGIGGMVARGWLARTTRTSANAGSGVVVPPSARTSPSTERGKTEETPSATASATERATDNVEMLTLRIVDAPADSAVFADGQAVGTAPGSIRLRKQASHTLVIEVRAAGYQPRSFRIPADVDQQLSAKLLAARTTVAHQPGKNVGSTGDLENPF